MLAVTTARGTSALDHSVVSAVCFVWGLLARYRMNSDKEVASSLRSQFSLFIQRRGADSLEETSGQAGVSRGDESSLPHSRGTVSYPRQFNSMSPTIMSQCVWGEPFQSVFPTATPTSNFPVAILLSLMVRTSRQTFLHLRSEVLRATTSTPPTYVFRLRILARIFFSIYHEALAKFLFWGGSSFELMRSSCILQSAECPASKRVLPSLKAHCV